MKSLWSDDLLLLTEAHSLDTQDEAIQLTLLLLSLFDLRTSLCFSLSHLVICIYEKKPSSLHLNELFKIKFLCEKRLLTGIHKNSKFYKESAGKPNNDI